MCCSPRKLWFGGNFVLMAFLGLFLTSCHGSSYELDGYNRQRKQMDVQDYQQEYQKYQQNGGYPQGNAAPTMSNGGAPVKVVPDYYYQQQGGQQGYQAAPAQGQRRAVQQQRPNANYPQSRMQYSPPNSRSYDNPYSFQPPAQYPYYDADSYYVPPAQYYDDEMIDKERSPLGRQ